MNTWRNLQGLKAEEIIDFLERYMPPGIAPKKILVLKHKRILIKDKIDAKIEYFKNADLNYEEEQRIINSINRYEKQLEKLEKKIEVKK